MTIELIAKQGIYREVVNDVVSVTAPIRTQIGESILLTLKDGSEKQYLRKDYNWRVVK